MQRLRVALCRVFAVVLSGCGNDPPKVTGPAALQYVPADADVVVVVPTDSKASSTSASARWRGSSI